VGWQRDGDRAAREALLQREPRCRSRDSCVAPANSCARSHMRPPTPPA